jgi:hypothetical protein
VSDADATFSTTQDFLIWTGAITANRAANLPALSAVEVGRRFTVKDCTTSGTFTITLTRNGTDQIDGVASNVAITTGNSGLKHTLTVRKFNSSTWIVE